jgi:hypothetical protein
MSTSGRRHDNWPSCRSNGRTFGEPAIYPTDIFSDGLIVLYESQPDGQTVYIRGQS